MSSSVAKKLWNKLHGASPARCPLGKFYFSEKA